MSDDAARDPVAHGPRSTQARIGLGRAGRGMPTAAMLAFQLDHARARDAVHTPLDVAAVTAALGGSAVVVDSGAADRAAYLTRPDLGRCLAPASAAALAAQRQGGCDLAIVLADGLSAAALHAHGAAVATLVMAALADWRIAVPVIARQGRVALGDAIGAALDAAMVLVLIGERPGLSSPDSLGAYLTWAPMVGQRDSERNCVSNIRPPHGLSHADARDTIVWLLREARRRGGSGVALKDLRQSGLVTGDG
ncbi:ethanolamine ammonia-lyase subunit EutC [Sphingomonas sp. Leaf25]|uniref:ethanolamine ammonia-lyase subunit EutC n=1 Tax=Sphingomonas sp. Leaf25 TaxID=1735692 RepID=UPI0006F57829|nr:ethanolamine ammonia-lyase subunit EutC [Sphingomonas sp. Leaf25]KQM96549.1 hypothetical protein ASE78_11115 [Sphingomonas sp. Leaf25]